MKPECGDGFVDEGEECDDGDSNDDVAPDACRTSCRLPSCGDWVIDQGEDCDDGDRNSDSEPDRCRSTCLNPSCGDAVVDRGEECDDGELNDDVTPGACRTSCMPPSCGDRIVDPGEECDEGDDNDDSLPDRCRIACVTEYCGDGVQDAGEQCDDGAGNDDGAADACRASCLLAHCGDGVVDDGEACDDGALNSDESPDACRTICDLPWCGDGVIDRGESCDEGSENSDDDPEGCRTNCALASCGDGVVDPGEECDDGVENDNLRVDGCRTTCVLAYCGDGTVDSGEACDSGAGNSDVTTDACRTSCVLPSCGDGVVDSGEGCDSGAGNSDLAADVCRTSCVPASCGDGVIDTPDACDDGNRTNSDGCDADCLPTRVVSIAAGASHTCALLRAGDVRCWGWAADGRLGYPGFGDVALGDDEGEMPPASLNLGGSASALAVGGLHSCAIMESGPVRCWGWGILGALGYNEGDSIGDDEGEMPPGDLNVGGVVAMIEAGDAHTCAVLDTGDVRCWGSGGSGRLGYESTANVGDDPLRPMPPANVDVGGSVEALALGASHTCALLDTNRVRCWGYGGMGRLGYGNTNDIGDGDEMPPASVAIGVPADTVEAIASGGNHSCAIIGPSMGVRCWGSGSSGQLGYGSTSNIGDGPGEMPPSIVNLGANARVVELAVGASHTCARLETGTVRCWGSGASGQLGYGTTSNIGDDGNPAMPPGDVDVGGTVEAVAAGASHTCALLDTGRIRCWGEGSAGQLGYGNAEDVGDDESPASAGDVPLF